MFSWLKGKKAKIRQTSRRRRTALGVEGLEGRALLAGVVDVFVSGGTLFLTGDALSNGVAVVGTGVPGQFAVIGVANAVGAGTGPDVSAGTTIRALGAAPAAFVLVNGVSSIFANLGDGNDQFAVTSGVGSGYYGAVLLGEYASNGFATPAVAAPAGSSAALSGSITVLAGNGNDAVAILVITPSVIAIDTGSGNDYAVLENTTTANLAINTGALDTDLAGSDRVRVRNSVVQAAIGINTFGGSDNVDVLSTNAPAIGINTGENGGAVPVGYNPAIPENVRVSGVTSLSVAVNTNGGNDLVIIGTVAGVSAAPTVIGVLGVNTFDGDDVVLILTATVTSGFTVTTGLGNDIVQVQAVISPFATIDTSSGTDFVLLIGLIVPFNVFVTLGDGDDNIQVFGSTAGSGSIFGQGGTDTYITGGSFGYTFFQ
jgi:hypothetical protein